MTKCSSWTISVGVSSGTTQTMKPLYHNSRKLLRWRRRLIICTYLTLQSLDIVPTKSSYPYVLQAITNQRPELCPAAPIFAPSAPRRRGGFVIKDVATV